MTGSPEISSQQMNMVNLFYRNQVQVSTEYTVLAHIGDR